MEPAHDDPSARAPRSELRLRRGHLQPGREHETIVEVVRGGAVVATIYGSREGVHIVSGRLGRDGAGILPFFIDVDPGTPGIVVPLLARGEKCPWCGGLRRIALSDQGPIRPCPVCGESVSE